MNYSYENNVIPYASKFHKVIIPEDKILKLENFVKELVDAKMKESHHKIDGNNEFKRHYTGLLGELALEELLGISIIDWSIGNSNEYNNADILDLKIGIKTVEYGKFPIIFKKNYYPQIINIKTRRNIVFVCGLATGFVLNECQDDDLILSPSLRARNTKTGFYGFDKLKQFKSLEDLKRIYKK